MIIVLAAWIYQGQWMWHLTVRGRVLQWSRLKNFAEEYMFFTYCAIGESD